MTSISKQEVLVIARVMHEAIRAFQAAHDQPTSPHWNKAPRWMKDASIAGAKFRIENPKASASDQHVQWMNEKKENGWKLGTVKDPIAKTHPLLIPYGELPELERQKDALVAGIINALTMDV